MNGAPYRVCSVSTAARGSGSLGRPVSRPGAPSEARGLAEALCRGHSLCEWGHTMACIKMLYSVSFLFVIWEECVEMRWVVWEREFRKIHGKFKYLLKVEKSMLR